MSFKIKHYHVQLGNSRTRRINDKDIEYYALILCKDSMGKYLIIFFLAPGSPKIQNQYTEQSASPLKYVAQMFLPAEQYEWYIDLLRNEKPVHAAITGSRPEQFRITVEEPPGDAERLIGIDI